MFENTFANGGIDLGILKIKFENVKSLKDSYLTLADLNVLLGRNGSGKTNIQKYLNYFYENLTENNIKTDIFDKENPYNDYAKISIQYNLRDFIRIDNPEQDIFKQLNKIMDDKNTITILLTQYKNNTIHWNHPYEVRKIIKYIFPIYFIDVRNIDLFDWENIWDLIGDLGQRRSEQEQNLPLELDALLQKIYGKKYFENLTLLKGELESLGYGVVPYKNSGKFKQLYKFNFGGEVFNYNDNKLEFYSTGSNSFNYLRIFYLVLNKLHLDKLKHPLVILDEPEIGLHPTLIDELIGFISMDDGRVKTLLSTHSSRVIKNSIVLSKVNIFQVSEQNNRTTIKKVKAFEDSKLNKIISDKEASYYFSSGILFVEGITEYELFTNKYIQYIYPVLKDIEIFSYDSNNISLDVSHPNQRKMNIPYLLLLDMDKILKYNDERNKFDVIGDSYNPLKNTNIARFEKFYYGEKRVIRNWRNRIEGITDKVEFRLDNNNFAFNDNFFILLKNLIKSYCNNYYVYPVETTIEGVLINEENYNMFYEWITNEKSNYREKEKVKEAFNKSNNTIYRINILRTLVEGKLESLVQLKEKHLTDSQDENVKTGYNIVLNLPRVKKGSGWVSEYLEFVYDTLRNRNALNNFNSLFPELTDIMKTLEIIRK